MYVCTAFVAKFADDCEFESSCCFFTGLRKIIIVLKTETKFPNQNQQAAPEGSLFLSKVTGLVALKRMPQLELELKVHSECES